MGNAGPVVQRNSLIDWKLVAIVFHQIMVSSDPIRSDVQPGRVVTKQIRFRPVGRLCSVSGFRGDGAARESRKDTEPVKYLQGENQFATHDSILWINLNACPLASAEDLGSCKTAWAASIASDCFCRYLLMAAATISERFKFSSTVLASLRPSATASAIAEIIE